jgi:hypothetical protein
MKSSISVATSKVIFSVFCEELLLDELLELDEDELEELLELEEELEELLELDAMTELDDELLELEDELLELEDELLELEDELLELEDELDELLELEELLEDSSLEPPFESPPQAVSANEAVIRASNIDLLSII